MELRDALAGGRASVRPERFAVVKASGDSADAFAVIRDGRETTWVIEESRLGPSSPLALEPGWRLVTFDMVLPFGLVGFLAEVAGALAKAGVSLFALSAYSTDHILVKEIDLEKAVKALKGLGIAVTLLGQPGGKKRGK